MARFIIFYFCDALPRALGDHLKRFFAKEICMVKCPEEMDSFTLQTDDFVLVDSGDKFPVSNSLKILHQFSPFSLKPFIFLPSYKEDEDLISLHENAFVFYKPLRLNEIIQRIRTLLDTQCQHSKIALGKFTLNCSTRQLSYEETSIRLTAKETKMLWYLYTHDNIRVDRELLLQNIWNYRPTVTTHTLETHLYRLRQKISTLTKETPLIVCRDGLYKLVHSI